MTGWSGLFAGVAFSLRYRANLFAWQSVFKQGQAEVSKLKVEKAQIIKPRQQ